MSLTASSTEEIYDEIYFNLRTQFFNIKAHHHAFETND